MFLDQNPDIPFRVLRFLVTEINYGGRVTDDKDRRLMSNLINNFLGPEVLDPNYKFSASGVSASQCALVWCWLCVRGLLFYKVCCLLNVALCCFHCHELVMS